MSQLSTQADISTATFSALGKPVWEAITDEARDLMSRETLLTPLLEEQVIAPAGDGAEILARVLSARLSSPALAPLMSDILTSDTTILEAVDADLAAVYQRDPACDTFLHALINLKGFHGLQTYRIAHRLWRDGRRDLAKWLSNLASSVFGPDIHPAARIGSSIMLDHGSGIVIGETTEIDDEVSILQNVTLGGTGKESGNRHPKIGRGVMIGAGAKVLGNIRVGDFSKVAAGSVVLRPVPARCTVAGVPATVVRLHRADEVPAGSMDQDI